MLFDFGAIIIENCDSFCINKLLCRLFGSDTTCSFKIQSIQLNFPLGSFWSTRKYCLIRLNYVMFIRTNLPEKCSSEMHFLPLEMLLIYRGRPHHPPPFPHRLRALICHYRALSFDHLTAVSGMGSPTEPTDWSVSYELKYS